ncbi:MAG TPA: NAD-dependent epimerase/dehydratase family protein [Labilithrix sp.]
MSRVLLTGATGFLGRHVARQLLESGHGCVALVRARGADLPDGVEQRKGDVLDRASVEAALEGCDAVVHCAGRVSRKPEDAEELHRVHVEGTKNVLAAAIARGVRRAVVASTSGTIAVGEDPDRVYTEDDDAPIGLLNRWPYYRAKLFAEKAALEQNGKIEVVVVNPTLLLGPGDVNGSSTEDVRLFLERKIPAVPPGGLSYVDVRDAALGLVLALELGTPGRRYLLGACNLTIKEFFGRLERVSGVRAPVLPMPRAPEVARAGAQMLERIASRLGVSGLLSGVDPVSLDMAQFYWYLDATRAEEELGWTPRDPTETLSDTVKDLESRGVVWPNPGGAASIASSLSKLVSRDTP